MGLFDFFKKRSAPPVVKTWDDLDARARVTQIITPVLEDVAAKAGAASTAIVPSADAKSVSLRGVLEGQPLQVAVSWSGTVDVEVRYDEELAFIDIELDPDAKPASAAAWTASDQSIALGAGVAIKGSRASEEKREFDALPEALRARIVSEIGLHRVRLFRSRPWETTASLSDSFDKLADPSATLLAVLRLALATAKGRGVRPSPLPGSPFDPSAPFAGWRPLGADEKWARAIQFAQGVAAKVGGRVHEDREELEIEVRWTEGADALRISVDLTFLRVTATALARGVEGTFDLFRNPSIKVDERRVGDAWDDDDIVFIAPSVFLRGDEEKVHAEAALLRSLPRATLDELLALMERFTLHWLSLEEGTLDVHIEPFVRTDDGTTAIAVARQLGRVVRALPKGDAPARPRDRVVRCKFCHALWFPSDLEPRCTHCGAPG